MNNQALGDTVFDEDMKTYQACQFGREEINRAGGQLISLPINDPVRRRAIKIVNDWRSCHAYPLQAIRNTLAKRAASISSEPLIAQWIKRMPSIALKLSQNTTRLTQMQDIGGCRAVVDTVEEVDKLVAIYEKTADRQSSSHPRLLKKFDYIQQPKPDGYRSVHLVMQFHGKAEYDGQKIEIQIRSKLQHAWATALETCQTFTNQALKSRIKAAHPHWLKFFSWTSSAIALKERRQIVPGTTRDTVERREHINYIINTKDIFQQFRAWNEIIKHHELHTNEEKDAYAYLLELNTSSQTLTITGYAKSEMRKAQAEYLAREEAIEGERNSQVVLVAAGSLANLKRAYPNYYLDTTEFMNAIRRICMDPNSPTVWPASDTAL